MKCLFPFFYLLLVHFATAQNNTVKFSLLAPSQKVLGSLYSGIEVLDIRYDTGSLGIIQQGFSKKIFTVLPDTSFTVQAQKILDQVAENAANGKLLLLLRFFKFIELMDRSKQTGYCYIRADMYAEKGNRYFRLSGIDTAISIQRSSYSELNPLLFRESSNAVTGFISKNCLLAPLNEISYTFEELLKIDSIEKRTIPVYNATVYTDGIYLSYQSFRDQLPDYEIKSVDTSDNEIAMLHAKAVGGGTKRINPREVFAVIKSGIIYMPAERGFGILKKRGDDFFLRGEAAVTYGNVAGHKIVGTVLLGVPGIFSNPKASYQYFEMKLDYIDGLFIKTRELTREEIKKLKKGGPDN